jgi:predicted GIY-YIG superfamily endonuclease
MKRNRKEYAKQYYLKNREKLLKQRAEYRETLKQDYYSVYLLEDYNYVGVTNQIKLRFAEHKRKHNRDCTNYRILYKTKSKKDARELELLLHDLGYEGKHTHFDWTKNMTKQQISLMRKQAALKMWETRKL